MEELVDDIDGTVLGRGGESISYAVDGAERVINLKDEHAKELRETFEYYIAPSTRVGGPQPPRGPGLSPPCGRATTGAEPMS